jgi:hypothetical protein
MLQGEGTAPLSGQSVTGPVPPTELASGAVLPPSLTTQTVPVSFQLNDSMVKNMVLPEVAVHIALTETGDFLATGKTDKEGRFSFALVPGTYFVSYKKTGYIPIANSVIEISPERPNHITVTLTMIMEELETARSRRIQIVLNWGSRPEDVPDVDSHLFCACTKPTAHVYFNSKNHATPDHNADLDVDDTDGGGPETITVTNPPPGQYLFWAHDYPGGKNRLGTSELVVRAFFDNRMVGEYRIASDVETRTWMPFQEIRVDQEHQAHIIPFSESALRAGLHLKNPEESLAQPFSPDDPETTITPQPRPTRQPSRRDRTKGPLDSLLGLIIFVGIILRIYFRKPPAPKGD